MTLKTCIIKYLPAGNQSHTNELLQQFLGIIPAGFDMETIDLLKNNPPIWDETTLPLYIKKGYQGINLAELELHAYQEFTEILEPLKKNDILILVTPMHNFSFPGLVKCYIDAIMQYGETWKKENDQYVGLMKGKKILILASAGGSYKNHPGSPDFLTPLAKTIFGLMGFEVEVIIAEKMAAPEDIVKQSIFETKKQITEIINKWYV